MRGGEVEDLAITSPKVICQACDRETLYLSYAGHRPAADHTLSVSSPWLRNSVVDLSMFSGTHDLVFVTLLYTRSKGQEEFLLYAILAPGLRPRGGLNS